MTRRFLLISTLNFNPGDEFIRLGVEHLLRQIDSASVFEIVHKHDPRTLFEGFKSRGGRPNRLVMPLLYWLYANTSGRNERNLLESADVVVFAGTPFIWRTSAKVFRPTCANAEWVRFTWARLFKTNRDKPVLNLAAGTAISNEDQARSLLRDEHVKSFLKNAAARSALTTARDSLTRDLLGQLGFNVPLIPCASLFAARGAGIRPAQPQYVAVNLMAAAAHRPRGERADPESWRQIIQEALPHIERRHKIVFISHSPDEDATAAAWFPGRERIFSRDPKILLDAYSKASFAICNRVHGAAAVASFGRPALVIGSDSRIDLIRHFGLPAADYRDLDHQKLTVLVEELESNYSRHLDTLEERSGIAQAEYLKAIRTALNL